MSRETRLLLVTIGVSVAVLFVLARFRFPGEGGVPPAAPLERLATGGSFDALATDVARTQQRVADALVVLRGHTTGTRSATSLHDIVARGGTTADAIVYVPALRVRHDAAVALLEADVAIEGVLGHPDAVPLVIAFDPLRRLAVVRVPEAVAGAAWQLAPLDPVSVPRYVVAAEGSRSGAVMRPFFLGRDDRLEEPRWATPLVATGTTPAGEGAFVFSLAGELIGMTVRAGAAGAIVPAATLAEAATRLLDDGAPPLTDFGLTLRPLTGSDVTALGTANGLFVERVVTGAPAAGRLRAGDLLVAVDGVPAIEAEATLVRLAAVRPGRTVTFSIRRDGAVADVAVVVPRNTPEAGSPE